MTDDALKYIANEGLILIPVLYIIGMILKGFKKIPDKYIPVILLLFGEVFALLLLGLNVQSVIQGILLTGVTVYGNQVMKQFNNSNEK